MQTRPSRSGQNRQNLQHHAAGKRQILLKLPITTAAIPSNEAPSLFLVNDASALRLF